jgi:hypothetical protein
MLRGRLMGFGEALGRCFDYLRWIARRLQPATLAICLALNGTLLAIISPIITCCDSARCGAILGGGNCLFFRHLPYWALPTILLPPTKHA